MLLCSPCCIMLEARPFNRRMAGSAFSGDVDEYFAARRVLAFSPCVGNIGTCERMYLNLHLKITACCASKGEEAVEFYPNETENLQVRVLKKKIYAAKGRFREVPCESFHVACRGLPQTQKRRAYHISNLG